MILKCKLKKTTTIWHPNQDKWTFLITGTVNLNKRKNCIVAGINLTLGGDLIHLSSTILHLCQGCDITYDHDVWPSGVAVAGWRKLHCIGTHTMYWQEIDTSPPPPRCQKKKLVIWIIRYVQLLKMSDVCDSSRGLKSKSQQAKSQSALLRQRAKNQGR